jgi:hypothetical protein
VRATGNRAWIAVHGLLLLVCILAFPAIGCGPAGLLEKPNASASQSTDATSASDAAHTEQDQRFLIKVDGLYGFIDATGRVVIQPQYAMAGDFGDGLAPVWDGDRRDYIDSSGRVMLDLPHVILGVFSEGLAGVMPDEQSVGFIDLTGKLVIPAIFEDTGPFREGLAAAKKKGAAAYGYIDKTGEFAIEPQFNGARDFSEGLSPVWVRGLLGRRWGYIDRTGAYVIKPQFADAQEFVEGLAPACAKVGPEKWLWGYIDRTGAWVIEPQFESAGCCGSGLAPVQVATEDGLSGRWGYIDKTGRYVIEPRYLGAWSFHGGLALVELLSGKDGYSEAYIDPAGKAVWTGPFKRFSTP